MTKSLVKSRKATMNKIQYINDKINKLKLELETKLARELYKKIENILKEDFSPQLVTVILEQNWNKTSPKQKERWQSKARIFVFP